MARLVLAVLLVGVLLFGIAVFALGLHAVLRTADGERGIDMAENGLLSRLAYFLLLALILYVSVTASGA